MEPTVSIIIATYNRAHFLPEMLNSVLKQSFKLWECLVIDDGSIDNTSQIVAKYKEQNERFQYLKRTESYKKGLPGCRNLGLDKAKGQYVVFFDDDDIAHPLLLQLAVKGISQNDADFCRYLRTTFSGDFDKVFDENEASQIEEIGIGDLEDILTHKIPFNSCQILWNSRCFHRNRFVEDLMYAEEWELYSRIISEGRKGVSLQKTLYFGRKHADSNTGEFLRNDEMRKSSFLKAHFLVLENLGKKNLLTPELKKLFLRMSFFLNSRELLAMILKYADFRKSQKIKLRLGFLFYPIIRPMFILKGKLINS